LQDQVKLPASKLQDQVKLSSSNCKAKWNYLLATARPSEIE
jgi:hypothetical protein